MEKSIRTLTVFYDIAISPREIPLFRGAVIKTVGEKVNLLYHNHTGDDTYRYAYPLIQYKRLNGKAAITCVEEGAEIIGQFLSEASDPIMIGERETNCDVAHVLSDKTMVRILEESAQYHLYHWLPLNSKNYQLYQKAESMVEKIGILENVLAGNILSFLKGMDIRLEEKFELHITDIINQKTVRYKNVRRMAFAIDFKANISLPSYIGIGKNASIGCGVLTTK